MNKKPENRPRHLFQTNRHTTAVATLKPFLEQLVTTYNREHWITSDPIQYAHRYSDPKDQEIAAFIAACFAYGSVQLVHRAVNWVLAPMSVAGESPSHFVGHYKRESAWPGFYHRFHHEKHVELLVDILREALEKYGSLSELFRQNAAKDSDGSLCERVLDGAARWFQEAARRRVKKSPELWRGMRFFFNSPSGNSACKRMSMFLRWMVRKDEVDLGLWDWMSAADLVIPADTHVGRIAFYLRLRGGKENQAPNWKMAKEITRSLQDFFPEDPVRCDFALARLGILDICKKEYTKSICQRCPVESGCRFSNLAEAK